MHNVSNRLRPAHRYWWRRQQRKTQNSFHNLLIHVISIWCKSIPFYLLPHDWSATNYVCIGRTEATSLDDNNMLNSISVILRSSHLLHFIFYCFSPNWNITRLLRTITGTAQHRYLLFILLFIAPRRITSHQWNERKRNWFSRAAYIISSERFPFCVASIFSSSSFFSSFNRRCFYRLCL